MDSIKVQNGACFALFLPFIELIQHLVQVFLLTKDQHLIVVDVEQFLLQIKADEGIEALSQNVESKGASRNSSGLFPESILL